MKDKEIVETASYNGHPVITGNVKTFCYSKRYLQNNQDLLDRTVARHCKVMAVRLDLKYPQDHPGTSSNKHFSQTMRTFTRSLSRNGLDPQYAAKREQESSQHQHYHVDLLLDGSKVKKYYPVIEEVAKHWGSALGISAEQAMDCISRCDKRSDGTPQDNGIMIRRGTPEYERQYDAVFKQMSYLAKLKPEDVTSSNVKKVFYSQYKRDNSRGKS